MMNTNKTTTQTASQQGKESSESKRAENKQRSSVEVKGDGNGKKEMSRKGGETALQQPHAAFASMRRFAEDMDRLFDAFSFRPAHLHARHSPMKELWSPQIDVFQKGDQLIVRADLPGLSKDDIQVELTDGGLTIHGERREEHEEKEENYYHSERSCGSFFRSIPLPEGVDTKSISANFKDGVLEVTMKAPASQSRQRIEIKDS